MAKKIGELIREARKEKGISLRALAGKVGVSFVNISYIENGRIETSKNVLRKISIALDYDLDKLLASVNEVNDDIKNIINKRPVVVPDFLRTAKNLTNDDWKKINNYAKKIKRRKSK